MIARIAIILMFLVALARMPAEAEIIVLRYSHMNSPYSVAGKQAIFFAKKVDEYSRGTVRIELHPSSLLGTLTEQLNQVTRGTVAIHHNTAGAFGELAEDFAVFDTPYLYRDVQHLMKVVAPDSPVMKRLNEKLLRASGLRVLYTFYFGARQLTCDRPILSPQDLRGVKIRAIPFQLYMTAVEGLGAIPVGIDWADTPTALAAKAVSGQENPVNTILTSRLYESQKFLMLTSHIHGAEFVVINEAVWQKLPRAARDQISRAARDATEYGSRLMIEEEGRDIEDLKSKGMVVIAEREGLAVEEFRTRATATIRERYGVRWKEYYRMIENIR